MTDDMRKINQEQTIAIFRVLQFIPDGGNMLKKNQN
jgi:hypothetical protein